MALLADQDFSGAACLGDDEEPTSVVKVQPQPEPPLPNGYWYLGRGQNLCGRGTWGDGTGSPDPRDPLDGTGSPCP